MSKSDKIDFLDKISTMLEYYCPEMSFRVRYWVACQFALESNYGTSHLACESHNLCGMKIPHYRCSMNVAVTGNFAKFRSDVECVIDYVYLLCYNKFNYLDFADLDLYRKKLQACKYCPDSDYIEKVNQIYKNYV